jgi:hypothetical protein
LAVDARWSCDEGVQGETLPEAVTRRQAFLLWIEASAALMLIGAFGPWIKALGVSVSGTDGSNDGWIVVVAAVFGGVVAAITYKNRGAGVCALIGGVAGLSTAAYDRSNIQDRISNGGALLRSVATVGWGLNLCLFASISLAIAGAVWLFKMPSEETPPTPSEAPPTPSVAVEPDPDLARAIEAGLVEFDPERRMWVPRQRPQ